MARCPEGQGKGWGVSQAPTCSSCLETSSPVSPAFPSISLHWGSKPKVCTRNLGQHPPEGDIQVLVRPQAREDQSLQRLAHNAPGASDTCRNPPSHLPHPHPQLSGLAQFRPSTLPQLPQEAPMFLPCSLNVPTLFHISLCQTPGYLCLWKSYFPRPISTTKCHLLREVSPGSTVRLSKAHYTLYLDM